jgi:hypothetical protein
VDGVNIGRFDVVIGFVGVPIVVVVIIDACVDMSFIDDNDKMMTGQ